MSMLSDVIRRKTTISDLLRRTISSITDSQIAIQGRSKSTSPPTIFVSDTNTILMADTVTITTTTNLGATYNTTGLYDISEYA